MIMITHNLICKFFNCIECVVLSKQKRFNTVTKRESKLMVFIPCCNVALSILAINKKFQYPDK